MCLYENIPYMRMCIHVCVCVSMLKQSYVIISTFNISPTNTHVQTERSAKVNAFVRGSEYNIHFRNFATSFSISFSTSTFCRFAIHSFIITR